MTFISKSIQVHDFQCNILRKINLILDGPEEGTGKRSTLLHLLHYAFRDKWMLINIPDCSYSIEFFFS